jgi:hypothetical protein
MFFVRGKRQPPAREASSRFVRKDEPATATTTGG